MKRTILSLLIVMGSATGCSSDDSDAPTGALRSPADSLGTATFILQDDEELLSRVVGYSFAPASLDFRARQEKALRPWTRSRFAEAIIDINFLAVSQQGEGELATNVATVTFDERFVPNRYVRGNLLDQLTGEEGVWGKHLGRGPSMVAKQSEYAIAALWPADNLIAWVVGPSSDIVTSVVRAIEQASAQLFLDSAD